VRIKDVEDRLRQFREIVVQLAPNPRRQEREGLNQALNMRILNGILAQAQAARDLRMFIRKLRGQAADVGQFPMVEGKQVVNHRYRLQP
jgi:hypothetical protein